MQCVAGDTDGKSYLRRLVVHQHNVGGLNGSIASQGPHCNADIGKCQHRSVIDAVADEGQFTAFIVRLQQFLHVAHLVGGHQLGMIFVEPQLPCHRLCYRLTVAGEHHGALHSELLQCPDSLLGVGLHLVGNDDMACIVAVDSHMNHCSHDVAAQRAGVHMSPHGFHHPHIAHADLLAVDARLHTFTGHFFDAFHLTVVMFLRISLAQGRRNGVSGEAFHMGGQVKQLALIEVIGMYGRDSKDALGERARLVEHYGSHL